MSTAGSEILRFGLVAVAGLVLDTAVSWSLAVLAGLPLTLAATIGFCTAAAMNYVLHEFWTFRHGAPRPSAGRAMRYLGALGATLAVRLVAVALLARILGTEGQELVILLAATGLSFLANYLVSKFLVFRPAAARDPGGL